MFLSPLETLRIFGSKPLATYLDFTAEMCPSESTPPLLILGLPLKTANIMFLKCAAKVRPAGGQLHQRQDPSWMVRQPLATKPVYFSLCLYWQISVQFLAAAGDRTFFGCKHYLASDVTKHLKCAHSPAPYLSAPLSQPCWGKFFSTSGNTLISCEHCIVKTVNYQASANFRSAVDQS